MASPSTEYESRWLSQPGWCPLSHHLAHHRAPPKPATSPESRCRKVGDSGHEAVPAERAD